MLEILSAIFSSIEDIDLEGLCPIDDHITIGISDDYDLDDEE